MAYMCGFYNKILHDLLKWRKNKRRDCLSLKQTSEAARTTAKGEREMVETQGVAEDMREGGDHIELYIPVT